MPVNRIDINSLLPAMASNATILVPNNRISNAILSAHGAITDTEVFLTPQVYAIDIWIRNLWELCAHSGLHPFSNWQLLNSAQEHLIWTTAIEQSLTEMPLLNPEDTAVIVNQSYRDLKQWLSPNPLARLQSHATTPDVIAFLQWISTYQQFCRQQQVINLVDAIEIMLEVPAEGWTAFPSLPSAIFLVNFLEPPPLYQALFSKLSNVATVKAASIRYDKPVENQKRAEFADPASEIIACAQWVQKLQAANPDQHIGIIYSEDILAHPETRHLLCSALGSNSLPAMHETESLFNSSGSRQTLNETGLVHDAFLLLNLMQSQQASVDLCRLLQSPFLLASEEEKEARLQMELLMRRRFTATTSIADFSWHLQQTERATHAPLLAGALLNARTRMRQFPAMASAREWARLFSDWLADFGWPGKPNASDRNTLALWHDTLRTFANSSSVLGDIGAGTALANLKSLCAQKPLACPFRPEIPLSVYSVAEAMGLQFDYVWLLGFSSQSWPAAAHPSPFIPYALQQAAKIPGSHSEFQLQRAGAQIDTLQFSVSRQLIASFHRQNGELEFSPSCFIDSWPPIEAESINTSPATLLATDTEASTLITITDPPVVELKAEETVKGGQSIISNQSSCPFRAFAKHRLRTEPLERFESGLGSRDRGSALHVALETLFSDLDSTHAIRALDADARKSKVANAAAQAISYLSGRHRELMTPRFRELELERICTLLERFLELECERSDFTVIAREQAMNWQYDKLQLGLKIDRIDQLNDQSLALIDYKTGKRSISSKTWLQDRAEDMQLPLYYTVATEQDHPPVSAITIAHVNAANISYSGLAANANLHTSIKPVNGDKPFNISWQDLTAIWQQSVRQRAHEFVMGQARVAPVNGRRTCEYCGLEPLCRIHELDLSGDEDESDWEQEA